MNAERQAFLDDLEAELTTTKAIRPVRVESRRAPVGSATKVARRLGVAVAVLASSMSMSALLASAAYATTAHAEAPVSVLSSCGTPDPVGHSHFKSCGVSGYQHDYRSQRAVGPGGQRTCYTFWSAMLDLGCGADPGHWTEACD